MEIKVEIDSACTEPVVIIRTSRVTDEINELIQKLSIANHKLLAGFDEDSVVLLDTDQVLRFYSENQKVYAATATSQFRVRLRLYELEERLNSTVFVRISNAEIVNLKAIQKLDLSFSGTIEMTLSNGTKTYVSRRYVSKVKELLGI